MRIFFSETPMCFRKIRSLKKKWSLVFLVGIMIASEYVSIIICPPTCGRRWGRRARALPHGPWPQRRRPPTHQAAWHRGCRRRSIALTLVGNEQQHITCVLLNIDVLNILHLFFKHFHKFRKFTHFSNI